MSIAETPEIKYKYIDQCIRGMPLVFLPPPKKLKSGILLYMRGDCI